jgi:hypothetical protein
MNRSAVYPGVGSLAISAVYVFFCWNANAGSVYRFWEAACTALLLAGALSLIVHRSGSSIWCALAATLIRFVLVIFYWVHCPNIHGTTFIVSALIPLIFVSLCVVALRQKEDPNKPVLP